MPLYRIDPSRPGRLVCQDCGLAVAGLPRRPCSPGHGCPPPWGGDPAAVAPRPARRDPGPHRAGLLRVLGGGALAANSLSMCLVLPALVGVPLAVVVWALASQDLAAMRAGGMDPAGRAGTEQARDWAVAGLILAGLGLVICAVIVGSVVGNGGVLFCLAGLFRFRVVLLARHL